MYGGPYYNAWQPQVQVPDQIYLVRQLCVDAFLFTATFFTIVYFHYSLHR